MKTLHLFLYCFLLLNIYNVTALDVDAGTIADSDQAQKVCPKVCRGKRMKWNGQWKYTTEDEEFNNGWAVCGCVKVCDVHTFFFTFSIFKQNS